MILVDASIIKSISTRAPFSCLDSTQLDHLFKDSYVESYDIGQRLYGPDELPSHLSFILTGEFRLLVHDPEFDKYSTISKYNPGRVLGWSSLLRGFGSDYSLCSSKASVLKFKSTYFLDIINENQKFGEFFRSKLSEIEIFLALSSYYNSRKIQVPNLLLRIEELSKFVSVVSFTPDINSFISLPKSEKDLILDPGFEWFMSTGCYQALVPGTNVKELHYLENAEAINIPLRILGVNKTNSSPSEYLGNTSVQQDKINENEMLKKSFNLQDLGILEEDKKSIQDLYPFVPGNSSSQQALAICQMLCAYDNIPFRRDAIQKVLEDYLRRDKEYSLEMFGGLLELIGYRCAIGETNCSNLFSLNLPAVIFNDKNPVILFGEIKQKIIIADPSNSKLSEMTYDEFLLEFSSDKIRFLIPNKVVATPNKTLTWSWFLPLVNKYKKSLFLVFCASLLAQLFGLAIPLLIQQIIDKVLAQGNLSSLNILGSAMIVLALFQGVLTALRTYIFVDTTDRMDLTLGSTVIQKLLSLPLGYFDKRPVGELSQRIGELNTIRGFLTGTALVSSLNILFALIYLVVMFMYSVPLSFVALSTIPVYILLVFFVSPIFKSLLRRRAVAQAKTQSHLIEVLNGMQTVKAQHFELTARWKWQDKYKNFVDEGFKSAVIGSTSGEIGKFLNTISGLMVLWFGMWLVLDGQLTLGMLIAFRIISSNVTGPLLQLSGLYQSFQKVQISMERLSDVIDQNSELDSSNSGELGKIILPPIEGNIEFRNVCFRFKEKGSWQVDGVSAKIKAGSFVGIVGQSGSGKSTLMKLLPKLYSPEDGQIFIDGFDIQKVDLASLRRQVGIVPQDSILFEGTIAENIALNDPNASTDSIIEAARIACAHDFIMELDDGYGTRIAERGSNLSGGQRQRIAVARTILANPQLLILDEATSALDFNTERQLCENLYAWAGQKTVFFITHRLSTIQNSDSIIVMNKGQLAETGSHDSLMNQKGRYFALYRQQLSSQILYTFCH